ncbi:tail protein [Synechococcus phage P60]|uniref:Tail tubular protein B n=1 Tax=Synechococcus phage P60 TaxID=2905923 RepID=L0CQ06_9CAUD|nr:tail protein [Synechococcus phage P60]AGA17889.1 tail tubular protein B [Synechococcus phage P60]
MAAVEQMVPNLLGGISQQPDPLKLPGQVKQARNVQLDPTFGALKRPGTELIMQVTGIPKRAKWIPIMRDAREHYYVAIYREGANESGDLRIRVFDLKAGVERAVSFVGGEVEEYFPGDETDWEAIRSLTIGDYTFLSNPNVQPTTWSRSFSRRPEGLVTIGAAGYGTSYIVDFATEDSGQQRRWAVQEMQAPKTKRKKGDGSPDEAGETTVNNWNGTGLSFRVKVEARAFLVDDGEEYGHNYIPYVTLLTPGNNTSPFPDTIRVDVSGEGWDIKVTKQIQSKVYANLGTAQFTTPVDQSGGGASTSDIVTGLSAAINGLGTFTAESIGNVIRVRYSDPTRTDEFTMSARGGTSGTGLESIKYSVDTLAELPTKCWNDYQVAVRNTQDTEVDDYYVKFETDVEDADVPGSGYWVETVKNGDDGGLVDDTMPHVLVRNALGDFTFSSLNNSSYGKTWADRSVGSEDTNPHPTFTESGNGIYGMFMYKNRLGFLTQDAVIMSQVGDYFNFYATSGVTISDADPIDMATSDTKPVKLEAAISSTSGAILFGNQAQFRLSSPDESFGPKTATLDKISNYTYESKADPVQTGVSMIFPTNMGTYSSVYELSTESAKGTPVIEDSSRVIPRLIPSGLTWSTASMNNDTVFFGNAKKGRNVYVFRFFNEGQERKVAGWTTWYYEDQIIEAEAYANLLYMVNWNPRNSVVTLCRSYMMDQDGDPITAGEFTYLPRVDKMIDSTNTDYLTVVGSDFRETTYQVATNWDDFAGGERLITTIYTDNDAGDYDFHVMQPDGLFKVPNGRPFKMGLTYQMELDLPNFFIKNDGRPDRISDVMVQGVYFDMYQSSGISVFVNLQGYEPYAGYLTPIDSDAYNADEAAMRVSGTEYMGMAAPGSQTFVTLTSANPYPSGLTSYSFQGIYNKRGYATIR